MQVRKWLISGEINYDGCRICNPPPRKDSSRLRSRWVLWEIGGHCVGHSLAFTSALWLWNGLSYVVPYAVIRNSTLQQGISLAVENCGLYSLLA